MLRMIQTKRKFEDAQAKSFSQGVSIGRYSRHRVDEIKKTLKALPPDNLRNCADSMDPFHEQYERSKGSLADSTGETMPHQKNLSGGGFFVIDETTEFESNLRHCGKEIIVAEAYYDMFEPLARQLMEEHPNANIQTIIRKLRKKLARPPYNSYYMRVTDADFLDPEDEIYNEIDDDVENVQRQMEERMEEEDLLEVAPVVRQGNNQALQAPRGLDAEAVGMGFAREMYRMAHQKSNTGYGGPSHVTFVSQQNGSVFGNNYAQGGGGSETAAGSSTGSSAESRSNENIPTPEYMRRFEERLNNKVQALQDGQDGQGSQIRDIHQATTDRKQPPPSAHFGRRRSNGDLNSVLPNNLGEKFGDSNSTPKPESSDSVTKSRQNHTNPLELIILDRYNKLKGEMEKTDSRLKYYQIHDPEGPDEIRELQELKSFMALDSCIEKDSNFVYKKLRGCALTQRVMPSSTELDNMPWADLTTQILDSNILLIEKNQVLVLIEGGFVDVVVASILPLVFTEQNRVSLNGTMVTVFWCTGGEASAATVLLSLLKIAFTGQREIHEETVDRVDPSNLDAFCWVDLDVATEGNDVGRLILNQEQLSSLYVCASDEEDYLNSRIKIIKAEIDPLQQAALLHLANIVMLSQCVFVQPGKLMLALGSASTFQHRGVVLEQLIFDEELSFQLDDEYSAKAFVKESDMVEPHFGIRTGAAADLFSGGNFLCLLAQKYAVEHLYTWHQYYGEFTKKEKDAFKKFLLDAHTHELQFDARKLPLPEQSEHFEQSKHELALSLRREGKLFDWYCHVYASAQQLQELAFSIAEKVETLEFTEWLEPEPLLSVNNPAVTENTSDGWGGWKVSTSNPKCHGCSLDIILGTQCSYCGCICYSGEPDPNCKACAYQTCPNCGILTKQCERNENGDKLYMCRGCKTTFSPDDSKNMKKESNETLKTTSSPTQFARSTATTQPACVFRPAYTSMAGASAGPEAPPASRDTGLAFAESKFHFGYPNEFDGEKDSDINCAATKSTPSSHQHQSGLCPTDATCSSDNGVETMATSQAATDSMLGSQPQFPGIHPTDTSPLSDNVMEKMVASGAGTKSLSRSWPQFGSLPTNVSSDNGMEKMAGSHADAKSLSVLKPQFGFNPAKETCLSDNTMGKMAASSDDPSSGAGRNDVATKPSIEGTLKKPATSDLFSSRIASVVEDSTEPFIEKTLEKSAGKDASSSEIASLNEFVTESSIEKTLKKPAATDAIASGIASVSKLTTEPSTEKPSKNQTAISSETAKAATETPIKKTLKKSQGRPVVPKRKSRRNMGLDPLLPSGGLPK